MFKNPLKYKMKQMQHLGTKPVRSRFGRSFGKPDFNSGKNPLKGFRGLRPPSAK